MMYENQEVDVCIIVVVTAFIMLFQLGNVPLLDSDKLVYAQTAIFAIIIVSQRVTLGTH